jgi:hypothetical protein
MNPDEVREDPALPESDIDEWEEPVEAFWQPLRALLGVHRALVL